MNTPEYCKYNTPETVAKNALRSTAYAFVDIINKLDTINPEWIGYPRKININNED